MEEQGQEEIRSLGGYIKLEYQVLVGIHESFIESINQELEDYIKSFNELMSKGVHTKEFDMPRSFSNSYTFSKKGIVTPS